MERIKQIWTQLEANNSAVPGLFKLRYSKTSQCDIFLGVKIPETHRLLILKAPMTIGKNFNIRYEFRGLKFDKIYDPDNSKYILLNLVLVDKQFKDVFNTLIADVISAIVNETDTKVILKSYSNRLIKWQSLFERFEQHGLTQQEQRGLYGEIFFIRKSLQINSELQNIITSWTGTENQNRDFQSGSWAVEVKTTHGNNHQKVQISSERQLDTNNLENLILYHISLEQQQNSGETLNDIVDSVIDLLSDDIVTLNKFKSKIHEVGYFDLHRNLYDSNGYHIRQEIFYKVENDFPRIEENDIRAGVGDVKYSIILSQCRHYAISETEMFDIVKIK